MPQLTDPSGYARAAVRVTKLSLSLPGSPEATDFLPALASLYCTSEYDEAACPVIQVALACTRAEARLLLGPAAADARLAVTVELLETGVGGLDAESPLAPEKGKPVKSSFLCRNLQLVLSDRDGEVPPAYRGPDPAEEGQSRLFAVRLGCVPEHHVLACRERLYEVLTGGDLGAYLAALLTLGWAGRLPWVVAPPDAGEGPAQLALEPCNPVEALRLLQERHGLYARGLRLFQGLDRGHCMSRERGKEVYAADEVRDLVLELRDSVAAPGDSPGCSYLRREGGRAASARVQAGAAEVRRPSSALAELGGSSVYVPAPAGTALAASEEAPAVPPSGGRAKLAWSRYEGKTTTPQELEEALQSGDGTMMLMCPGLDPRLFHPGVRVEARWEAQDRQADSGGWRPSSLSWGLDTSSPGPSAGAALMLDCAVVLRRHGPAPVPSRVEDTYAKARSGE